jgi:hypothetical protein
VVSNVIAQRFKLKEVNPRGESRKPVVCSKFWVFMIPRCSEHQRRNLPSGLRPRFSNFALLAFELPVVVAGPERRYFQGLGSRREGHFLSLFLRLFGPKWAILSRQLGGCSMDAQKELIAEFDREAKKTRKMLEAIPADADFEFKPHPKSMALGRLAGHLTDMTGD